MGFEKLGCYVMIMKRTVQLLTKPFGGNLNPFVIIVVTFVSDTEEEDFGGFSTQEEDDDTKINGRLFCYQGFVVLIQ